MPVRFSFLFYSCQKKNSWRYDIQGGRGNTLWEYNDNRNCFHGCTCLRTDATVHRYRPHSRRKNVCHRNSGRYAVLQSLCISVTNSLPYLMSILLVDFIAVHVLSRCPTSRPSKDWDDGTLRDTWDNLCSHSPFVLELSSERQVTCYFHL